MRRCAFVRMAAAAGAAPAIRLPVARIAVSDGFTADQIAEARRIADMIVDPADYADVIPGYWATTARALLAGAVLDAS